MKKKLTAEQIVAKLREAEVELAQGRAFSRSMCVSCRANVPYSEIFTDSGWADFDGDGDVDQSDFGLFQGCFSGDYLVSNPECFVNGGP